MDEPNNESAFKLWVVLAIIAISIFALFDEIRTGHIAITSTIFWFDLLVFCLSGLIGLGVLYFFNKYQVKWSYRFWISNALWWTLVAFPHGTLVVLNIFTMTIGSLIAFFCWIQVVKLLWNEKQSPLR